MKTVLAILLISTCVFAQVNFGTYVNNDSLRVTLGHTSDSVFVYFHFDRQGKISAGRTWTYRGDAAELPGYMNLWIYPDTVTTSVELDSLEISVQPVDEMGKAAFGPKVWCDFSQAIAEYDTTRHVLNFVLDQPYSCSLSGFTGPCYGIRVEIQHFCKSDSDSIYVPIKLVK
jgi:hypothetical protein